MPEGTDRRTAGVAVRPQGVFVVGVRRQLDLPLLFTVGADAAALCAEHRGQCDAEDGACDKTMPTRNFQKATNRHNPINTVTARKTGCSWARNRQSPQDAHPYRVRGCG